MRQKASRQQSSKSALKEIVLPNSLKTRLAQGHPWVYADHIREDPSLRSGDWVQLRCGGWRGIGLWDARSPIALRVFSQSEQPNPAWVRRRVEAAWQAREIVRSQQDTNAYRWIYGESDGLPGVVVDLYGDYAVIQTYADSLAVVVPWVVDALKATTSLRGIVERVRSTNEEEGERVRLRWGQMPPADLKVREHGLQFVANLFDGQKTGLFLDHRENRNYIRQRAKGLTVLNCFAYSGAFSVYAGMGGAKHVTSCDIAPGAMKDAEQNWRLNGLDPKRHEIVVADCFELLSRYASEGRNFDLIILDPPSFARSKQNMYAAMRAYTRLNTLALRCLKPGGWLASASCTSQVSPENFREILAQAAADAHKRLLIQHDAAHAPDHPVAAHFPEGRYLKFIYAAVQELP